MTYDNGMLTCKSASPYYEMEEHGIAACPDCGEHRPAWIRHPGVKPYRCPHPYHATHDKVEAIL